MKRISIGLLALLAASPVSAQPWHSEVLAWHNHERLRVGIPTIRWDAGLADAADQWAIELARSDRWGHSPKPWRPGQGENLWMGPTGVYPVRAMVGSWIDEKKLFRPGIFPAVSATGRWKDVGHYTQMIARRTTKVGCAIRSNTRWTYFVCRYGPSGNVDGHRFG